MPGGGSYGNNAGPGPAFQGTFDGLYHTINNITIHSGAQDVGIFGSNAGTINNVGVVGGAITGPGYVGGLVGFNFGTINNSFTQTTVTGTVVGGLAGGDGFASNASPGVINQSYAASDVVAAPGALFANGFIGLAGGGYGAVPSTNWSGTIKNSYNIPAGGAGSFGSAFFVIFCGCGPAQFYGAPFTSDLTWGGGVAQYASGLPTGFSPSIWGLVPGYSYPYLLWQFPAGTTPQAVSGAFTTISGAGVGGAPLALYINGSAVSGVNGVAGNSTTWTDGGGNYSFLVPQGTIGASSEVLVYAPTLTTTGAASFVQTSGNVSNNNLYSTYLGWTTPGTTISGLAAAETAAFGNNASIQSYANALPNLTITSTNANPFTVNQPLTETGAIAIFANGISVSSPITAGGAVSLTALNGSDVDVTAAIGSTGGSLSFTALKGGDVTVSAPLSTDGGAISLTAVNGGDVSVSAPLSTDGGAISLAAVNGGDVTVTVPINTASSFSAAGRNVTLQSVSWANAPLTITSTGTLNLDGVLTGTGSNAGGTISGTTITAPAISWQNGLLVISGTGAINLDGVLTGTGSDAGISISGTTVTAPLPINWQNGTLAINASGAVNLDGALIGTGTAGVSISGTTVTTTSPIYWQAAGLTITGSGAVNIEALINGIGPGAGASITGASVTTGGIGWEAGNLTLKATAGNVTANGDLFGWGPGASLTISGQNVSLQSAFWQNGPLSLTATQSVFVNGSLDGAGSGASANVTGQSVTINGVLQYQNGGLNLVASNGDINVGGGIDGGGGGAGGVISGKNVTLGGLLWAGGTMSTTATAGNLTINGDVDGMGSSTTPTTWNVSATGTIGVSGAVGVQTFNLTAGTWSQNTTGLAPFYAQSFNLNGGTFTRFAGGDGSLGNPYVIVDIYGLQGLVTTPSLWDNASTTDSAENFVLGANIEAGITSGWNGGAGFIPIGNAAQLFEGNLNGQNFEINGLTINRPGTDNIGLIGAANSAFGILQNLHLTSVNITGNNNVGAAVGQGGITIRNVNVTGNVTGEGNNVGGVSGWAFAGAGFDESGFFLDSFSGNVAAGTPEFVEISPTDFQGTPGAGTGGANVGGLVGLTTVSVIRSYALGTVTSQGLNSVNIGGLIGWLQSTSTDISNNASVIDSMAAVNVVALGNGLGAVFPGFYGAMMVGGLIGQNGNIGNDFNFHVGSNQRQIGGAVTSSFSTGSVTAAGNPVGGLIGYNAGTISNSWSSASVTIQGEGQDPENGAMTGVGRFGSNVGSISQSWATGAVNNRPEALPAAWSASTAPPARARACSTSEAPRFPIPTPPVQSMAMASSVASSAGSDRRDRDQQLFDRQRQRAGQPSGRIHRL